MSATDLPPTSQMFHPIRELMSYWVIEWRALLNEQMARAASQLPIPAVPAEHLSKHAGTLMERPSAAYPPTELRQLGVLPAAGTTIGLVVPETDVLRPHLRLPRVSKRLMLSALKSELARICPVDPTEVYFDFWISTADDRGAEVCMRVVRRCIVDDAIAICSQAFLGVAEMRFAGDPKPADWRRFPIDRKALLLAQWGRWRVTALTGFAVVLAILLVVAIYARGNRTLAALQQQIASAQEGAAQSERLRSELRSTAQAPSFLSRQKSAPSTIGIFAEVSQVLPNDSWLTALEVSDKKLRIQGYSRSASHLLSRMDSSRLFSNARFEAPLTEELPGAPQRFDIIADILR